MTIKKTLIAASLALASLASWAAPIVNDNVRPLAIGATPGSETSLQTVLDGKLAGVDANTDQSTAGLWGSATGVPASTIPTLVIEQTAGATSQTFGIWFGTDSSNLLMIDLLLGGANTGGIFPSAAGIVMNYGALQITGANCGVEINCDTIFDARINPLSFGFYFTGGGNTAMSIDNLSNNDPQEQARFLAYTDGLTNWLFAFEDGSDYDYNDMVVKVESIKVPEPGSLALLGAGLFGLAALRRRKA